MRRIFLVLILGVLSVPLDGGTREFASANRQYIVELSRAPENRILVEVFRVAKEAKTLHWSRAVEWEDPHPGWNSPDVDDVKALVTNSGETVVLRDYSTVSHKNDVRIIRKASKEERVVRAFDRRELTAAPAEEHPTGLLRMGASYLHVGALLDFIFEDENIYALWFGQTDQWLLISLENFQETVVKEEGKLRVLNEVARAQAKEKVVKHQPPPLRKMLGALRTKVAKLVPALASQPGRGYLDAETAAAYLFLAARQISSDRLYIEGLVNFPAKGVQHGHAWDSRGLNLSFCVTGERVVGDFLMSRWNGETNREVIAKPMYLLVPQDTFRSLGSIKFDLKFPLLVSSTNAGNLWAYIVPAAEAPENWDKAHELLMFSGSLADRGMGMERTLGPDGMVGIHGLTPGEYRAKFIWEQNRPAGTWRTNVYLGSSGDFESVLTEAIAVKAGETVTNVSVAVTNRIGAATAK